MRNGKYVLAICLFLILASFALPGYEVDASDEDVLQIRFSGGNVRYNESLQAFVPGVYQEVFINQAGSTANITFTKDDGNAQSKENYYSFSMDGETWSDTIYNFYILPDNCSSTVEGIVFMVGLNSSAKIGVWSLLVDVDGDVVFDDDIMVERYLFRYGIGRVDTFRFRVTPYDISEKELLTSSEYSILYNTGNVPFYIDAKMEGWDDVFDVTNTTNIVLPGEQRNLYITLNPERWSPRLITSTYSFIARIPYRIGDNASVSIEVQYEIPINMVVEVRLEDYALFIVGNMVLQYNEGPLVLGYEEERTVGIFLTSLEEEVEMDLRLDALNITLVSADMDGSPLDHTQPISFILTEEPPLHINITVRGDFSDAQGWLMYNLTNSDGVSGEVGTEFQTNPAPIPEETGASRNMMILVVLGIGILLFIVILAFYALKRKGEGKKGEGKKGEGKKGEGKKGEGKKGEGKKGEGKKDAGFKDEDEIIEDVDDGGDVDRGGKIGEEAEVVEKSKPEEA